MADDIETVRGGLRSDDGTMTERASTTFRIASSLIAATASATAVVHSDTGGQDSRV